MMRLTVSFVAMLWAMLAMAVTAPLNAHPPKSSDASLQIYSSSKEHLIRPLLDRFEHKTGISVAVTTLDGPALVSRLALEGNHTPADVLIIADVGNMASLTERNLLRAMRIESLNERVPPNLRHQDDLWTAIALRARFVFARADDKEAREGIKSYLDLADEAWRESVLIRSSDNVYNQSLMADMMIRHGEEAALDWAKGVVANMARRPQGGDRDQLRALASGEGRLAVANSYYYAMMLTDANATDRALAEKLKPVFFDDAPIHVNIRAAGITRHTDNMEQAQQLIRFLLSDEAQQYLTLKNFEYPAVASVAPSKLLSGWGYQPDVTYPVERIGSLNVNAVSLLSKAGWQ